MDVKTQIQLFQSEYCRGWSVYAEMVSIRLLLSDRVLPTIPDSSDRTPLPRFKLPLRPRAFYTSYSCTPTFFCAHSHKRLSAHICVHLDRFTTPLVQFASLAPSSIPVPAPALTKMWEEVMAFLQQQQPVSSSTSSKTDEQLQLAGVLSAFEAASAIVSADSHSLKGVQSQHHCFPSSPWLTGKGLEQCSVMTCTLRRQKTLACAPLCVKCKCIVSSAFFKELSVL